MAMTVNVQGETGAKFLVDLFSDFGGGPVESVPGRNGRRVAIGGPGELAVTIHPGPVEEADDGVGCAAIKPLHLFHDHEAEFGGVGVFRCDAVAAGEDAGGLEIAAMRHGEEDGQGAGADLDVGVGLLGLKGDDGEGEGGKEGAFPKHKGQPRREWAFLSSLEDSCGVFAALTGASYDAYPSSIGVVDGFPCDG